MNAEQQPAGEPAETLPTPRLRLGRDTIQYGPVRLVWGRLGSEIVIPLPGGAEVGPDELLRMARREGYAVVWPAELR